MASSFATSLGTTSSDVTSQLEEVLKKATERLEEIKGEGVHVSSSVASCCCGLHDAVTGFPIAFVRKDRSLRAIVPFICHCRQPEGIKKGRKKAVNTSSALDAQRTGIVELPTLRQLPAWTPCQSVTDQ